MINELPSIFEVVTGTAKKQVREKTSANNHSSSKSKSNSNLVKSRLNCIQILFINVLMRVIHVQFTIAFIEYRQHILKEHNRKKRKTRGWTRMKKNMVKPCVVLVERIMHPMSFGFAVTYVRSGFTENV